MRIGSVVLLLLLLGVCVIVGSAVAVVDVVVVSQRRRRGDGRHRGRLIALLSVGVCRLTVVVVVIVRLVVVLLLSRVHVMQVVVGRHSKMRCSSFRLLFLFFFVFCVRRRRS